MLTFVLYSANLIVRPRATIRAILADRRRVTFGFAGLLALTAVYVLALSVAIATNQTPAEQTLVLRIPARQYYVYERLLLLQRRLVGQFWLRVLPA